MYSGDYSFFDYKYNISGYSGQDYGGLAQYIYLIIAIIGLILFLWTLKKSSHDKVHKIIQGLTIFLIAFYIIKTTWESIYDIKLFGSFNTGLLPFDSCSLIMIAGLISSFCKGKVKDYSNAWIATGSIVGGIATMVRLNAFKFYPFLSFGASYSMIWHFLMVFIGLLLIVTNYVDINYKTLIKGFIFHLCFSLIVIPIDFIFDFDFMMYKYLGGIPFFESIGTKLIANGYIFLNPIIMLILYFIAFHIIYLIIVLIQKTKWINKLFS